MQISAKEGGSVDYVRWFSELSSKSTPEAGGKGANLGEMYSLGLPVPPGFVILASAYLKFLRETGLDKEIYSKLSKIDIERTAELEETSKEIKKRIMQEEIPTEIEKEINEAYDDLSVDKEALSHAKGDALLILKKARENIFVAVRSSATAEDSAEASFAGQQETFLNVKGKTNLLDSVKRCWASLFSARSIYYRIKKGFKHEQTAIAVVVQQMINSEKSGVIFSKDPVEKTDNIVIEAVFGLGEGIVSGAIAPDNHKVNRELNLLETKISDKKIAFVRNSGGDTEKVMLTSERSKSPVLTGYEIKKLAQYAVNLEEHYNKPQDIEFAIDTGRIFIVQTRPITTLEKRQDSSDKAYQELSGEVLLEGLAASPGIGSGVVKIIHTLEELSKIKRGDILVTEMTNPDMVVAMQKAAAVVTDEGGLTAHAAIVSREMGIPAVVGTRTATSTLVEGEEVTVNGFTGKVHKGRAERVEAEILPIIEGTKTKIKVIVDLPSFADRAAKTKASAVGLTRIEGIIAESGKHPFFYLKENKTDEYEEVIYKGISKIAEKFEEVWVRTSDLRSDEYQNLEGASKEVEANPMLGMHGIRASLKYPEILKAELNALKRVSNDLNKKIGILTPQVISVDEVRKLYQHIRDIGFHSAKIGVMIETPAAVQIIKNLCDEGISFISFGTNDLTQYTLAVDRGNEAVQSLYDEMHPAILKQIEQVIKVCKENGVETSICGQSASKKEMAKFLVESGIDSISLNADKAAEISQYIKELEEALGVGENREEVEEQENPQEEQEPEPREEPQEIQEEIEQEQEQEPQIEQEALLENPEKQESAEELVEAQESAEELIENVEEEAIEEVDENLLDEDSEETAEEKEQGEENQDDEDTALDIF